MILKPKGIDAPLQEMQKLFQDNLWVNVINKEFNHRVFRNRRDGMLIPEIFTGEGKEYKEVLFNDKLNVLSWFDVSDSTTGYELGEAVQEVGVFFVVNLKNLYPELSHRAVEESHYDVQRVLLMRLTEFKIQSIVTGERAYGNFDLSKLKYPDMQPWHTFKFVCNVNFQLSC